MARFVFLLAIMTMVGCNSSNEEASVWEPPRITGVVLPTTDGQYVPWSIDGEPDETWTPTEQDIQTGQEPIMRCIRDVDSSIFANLDKYRCQYVGILIDGKRRIYCNFFWFDIFADGWDTTLIQVLDGGDRYFQLEYDVEAEDCVRFAVNGVA